MEKIEKNERQSFTFYLSFYKAIKGLKRRERLIIYDAIVEYSLLGMMPEGLGAMSQMVWDLVYPTLSKSRANFLNACKTPHPKRQPSQVAADLPSEQVSEQGSERVSTDTYTETDTDTNTKTDTESKTDLQSAEQRPRPRRRSDVMPSKSARELMDEYLPKIRSDVMRGAIGQWFEYKRERGEPYRTLLGMQAFCLRLKELSDGNEYRAQQILQRSIANNWSGIFPLDDNYVPLAQRGEGYLRGYS